MRRSSADYDEPRRARGAGRVVGAVLSLVLIPLLIVAALLLPPVRLIDRIQQLGSTTIGASGGTLRDPDGTTIVFSPEYMFEPVQVSFDSIPRLDFEEGAAGNEWTAARNALAEAGLVAKSPLYEVTVAQGAVGQSILRIPVPNDSGTFETLDLYSWNGDRWEFVPSTVMISDETIEARIAGLPPANFIVMQTDAAPPRMDANIGEGEEAPANLALTTLAVGGYYLRGDGVLEVERASAPLGNYAVVPVLRNWRGMEAPRGDLLHNMLVQEGVMRNQLDAGRQSAGAEQLSGRDRGLPRTGCGSGGWAGVYPFHRTTGGPAARAGGEPLGGSARGGPAPGLFSGLEYAWI